MENHMNDSLDPQEDLKLQHNDAYSIMHYPVSSDFKVECLQ